MSIEISGLHEFAVSLQALKKTGVRRVVRNAASAGGTVILKAIRRHARARDKSDSGALGKSIIRVARTKRSTGVTSVYIGPSKAYEITDQVKDRRKGRRGKMRAVKRKPRRYAHLLEFGAKPHEIRVVLKSGKTVTFQHPGNPPEPFVRPGFDEAKAEAIEVFRQKVREGIEKELRKT